MVVEKNGYVFWNDGILDIIKKIFGLYYFCVVNFIVSDLKNNVIWFRVFVFGSNIFVRKLL